MLRAIFSRALQEATPDGADGHDGGAQAKRWSGGEGCGKIAPCEFASCLVPAV
jgi:hypothetical protein